MVKPKSGQEPAHCGALGGCGRGERPKELSYNLRTCHFSLGENSWKPEWMLRHHLGDRGKGRCGLILGTVMKTQNLGI